MCVCDVMSVDAQRRRGEDGRALGKQKEAYSHEVLTKCGIFFDIDGEGTWCGECRVGCGYVLPVAPAV